jgi:hypothetical protein
VKRRSPAQVGCRRGDCNTTPTGTHRQAGAVGHSPTNPDRPQAAFRSRAPRNDAEAASQDPGATHGIVATRFAHRGVPWDDDRQTGDDQRVSTVIRRAGATTMGKRCSPTRPWTTSGTGSDQEVSLSRAPQRRDNPGQPQRVGGTRTAWARTPATMPATSRAAMRPQASASPEAASWRDPHAALYIRPRQNIR